MPEFSIPFNAMINEEGESDRTYYAEDFARIFSMFLSNGVYPNPSSGLRVDASDTSMVLTVNQGWSIINGYSHGLYDETIKLAISPAHMSYNRKDSIVVQLNNTERWVKVLYKEGKATANPLSPVLIRNDDVYELKLAEILIKSGVQYITQADVTDTRLDKNVCGLVTHVVTSVDTTALFKQYETYLNQQITAWNARKNQQSTDWQNQMKSQQTGYNNKLNDIESRYSTLSQSYTNTLNQKVTDWNNTKSKQGTDWQSQMTSQQTAFNTKSGEIQAWYDALRADISKLQTFDFDNMASFLGCTRTTVKSGSNFVETVTFNSNGKTAAKRVTTKLSSGFKEVITAYEKDGTTVMKEFKITSTKTANGYSEVIS